MDELFMPFTMHRKFKKNPRLLERAEGVYYYSVEGEKILDGIAGLWCVNAGHCHPKIVRAVQEQVAKLDFAPSFNFGHSTAFKFAERVAGLVNPKRNLNRVFFTTDGSSAVETSIKMALAYHKIKGEGGRVRLIGRERAYHGVNFAGISVGGIMPNRKMYGTQLPLVDHLPHTYDPTRNAFSRGEPEYGIEYADSLERIVQLHDASTISAVIVEPVAGAGGVLPPPKGYLRRLREICDKHKILLIFDEVITGFGRLGESFATEYFDVTPDMICVAKGITNATVPCGAVILSREIFDTFMSGSENSIEFCHGYTYSGHPLAMAAGMATLDVYQEEGIFEHSREISKYFEDALHSLRGLPFVTDIRNLGLMAAIELEPIKGEPSKRSFNALTDSFQRGLMIRISGDAIVLSPPLIINKQQINRIIDTLTAVFKNLK